jgi:SSS family solute:Na+ symporter
LSTLDWVVLVGTLAAIVGYGVWKTRGVRKADTFLRGSKDLRWYAVGLSIMATQASAVTFLSVPGQAYEDGLGYVQFYLGLPIAMVLLSATIVPLYARLKVYTAYEYLEGRFDKKTRRLTALLFLVQRGLGTGISIYAPAIVVTSLLGWPLRLTCLAVGALAVVYTVSGGTQAVSRTQTWQMAVMLGGMAAAFAFIAHGLPGGLSLGEAFSIAGAMGKMKAVDYSLRFDSRYTFWSGLVGGLFVALAYFGTDQSQVQRYLAASSLKESRLGLLMNGLLKVPMQLGILLVGTLVFVFHQYERPPLFFDDAALARARTTSSAPELARLETRWADAFEQKRHAVEDWVQARRSGDSGGADQARVALRKAQTEGESLRSQTKQVVSQAVPGAAKQDADYIFIRFVTHHFPAGLVGLLLAVIFCAAMSSVASALNALGTTTVVDLYRPLLRPDASDEHSLKAARWFTVLWGVLAVGFAAVASLFENLIQAVNILGSLFYGPTLGVFLVGFLLRRVGGTAVFSGLILGQVVVLLVSRFSAIAFLWYPVVGCGCAVAVAWLASLVLPGPASAQPGSPEAGTFKLS